MSSFLTKEWYEKKSALITRMRNHITVPCIIAAGLGIPIAYAIGEHNLSLWFLVFFAVDLLVYHIQTSEIAMFDNMVDLFTQEEQKQKVRALKGI